MKKFKLMTVLGFLLAIGSLSAADAQKTDVQKTYKVGCVNFKKCVEESKLGKQEQGSFEALKKQAEISLEEKEKKLTDMATKLNDPDLLDMMSPEAETDLKRQFRALNQELTQLQNQYYTALNQANFKIIQNITEVIAKASEEVAKENGLDMLVNDEAFYFYNPSLDVSAKVIAKMDQIFDQESKTKPEAKLQ